MAQVHIANMVRVADVDCTTDTVTVHVGACRLHGISVVEVFSAHATLVQDDSVERFALPASLAVREIDCHGMYFRTSLVINPDNAQTTGQLLVFYEPVDTPVAA